MLGDELDVEVRPAEKLVRARDIKHVDLVVDRNAYEHLSSPRLRDVPIFDFCICRQVSANAIECHRRILVLALNCAGHRKFWPSPRLGRRQLTSFTSPASQFKVEFP
jgi:hypothetical protein